MDPPSTAPAAAPGGASPTPPQTQTMAAGGAAPRAFRAVVFTLERPAPSSPSAESLRALLRVLILLEKQGIPSSSIVIVDVASNPDHQFWVANQCGAAYPRYPQVFVGDKHIGSLKDLDSGKGGWRLWRAAGKASESSIQLKGAPTPPPSAAAAQANGAMAELGVVDHWMTAADWRAARSADIAAELASSSDDLETFAAQARQSLRLADLTSLALPAADEVPSLPASRLTQVLFAAAVQDRADIIDRLSGRIGIDVTDSDGRTPLQLAILRGHVCAVGALLRAGASASEGNPLHVACAAGRADVAAALIAAGAKRDAADAKGRTALHVACDLCHADIVSCLLAGAPAGLVDARDAEGSTALHLACSRGREDVVRCLLAAGARQDVTDRQGRRPLHVACSRACTAAIELLVGRADGPESVAAADLEGRTPLHYACEAGMLAAVDALLAVGPDPSQADKVNTSPLHVACRMGHADVVARLVDAGAKINAEDSTGRTPLRMACKERQLSAMDVLISRGADVDRADLFGATPLYVAASEGHLDVVQKLLAAGADANKPDKGGRSPMHAAIVQGHSDVEGRVGITEMLLAAGASPDAKDFEGWSPLRWASQQGHSRVVELLINARAEVCLSSSWEDSLRLACSFSNPSVCELLAAAVCHKAVLGTVSINLSSCGMRVLPRSVATLEADVLNLDDNALDSLPPELGFARIREVSYKNNPLETVPKSAAGSWAKLRQHLQLLSARSSPWREYKLVLLGRESSGKSTLVRCLRAKDGRDACKKKGNTSGVVVTEDIFSSFRPSTGGAVSPSAQTFAAACHAWDVSGRDAFLPIHQIFLRGSAVFLVVHDACERDTGAIEYFLAQILATHGGFSRAGAAGEAPAQPQKIPPIFVVMTRTDLAEESAIRELRVQYATRPGVLGVVGVSCKDGKGVLELRSMIADAGSSRLLRTVPPRFAVLTDYVRERRQRNIIDWPEYTAWAGRCGISSEDLAHASKFLVDTGTILCLEDTKLIGKLGAAEPAPLPAHAAGSPVARKTSSPQPPKHSPRAASLAEPPAGAPLPLPPPPQAPSCGSLVILNPQWLADVLAATLVFKPVHGAPLPPLPVNGVVDADRLAEVYGEFAAETVPTLIFAAERFDLIHKMNIGAKEYILVPSLLPHAWPTVELSKNWPQRAPPHQIEHRRVFKFPFAPTGLFWRIAIRVLRLPGVHPDVIWGNGLLVSSELESALVTYDEVGRVVQCEVRSVPTESIISRRGAIRSPHTVLRSIISVVHGLLDVSYPGLRKSGHPRELVPCTHCLQQRAPFFAPATFTVDECYQAAAEGALLVACPGAVSAPGAPPPLKLVRVDHAAPDVCCYTQDIPSEDISRAEVTGIGQYGRETPVTVKEARLLNEQEETLREFMLEAAVVRSLSHENVARLYGVAASAPPCVRLVYEHLPLGSLRSLLDRPDFAAWAVTERVRLALNVARGMSYLHGVVPPVTHRTLSSYSVLISQSASEPDRLIAKVSDAGIGRFLESSALSDPAQQAVSVMPLGGSEQRKRLSQQTEELWRWRAPECLDPACKQFWLGSDVYSFGVVLWELLCPSALPFDEYASDPRFAQAPSFETSVVVAIVKDRLRPTLPADSPQQLKDLVGSCLELKPLARPSFPAAASTIFSYLRAADTDATPPSSPKPASIVSSSSQLDLLKPAPQDLVLLAQTLKLTGPAPLAATTIGDRVWASLDDGSVAVLDGRAAELGHWRPSSNEGPSRVTAMASAGDVVWVATSDKTLSTWDRLTLELRARVSTGMPITCLVAPQTTPGRVWGGSATGFLMIFNSASLFAENQLTISTSLPSRHVACMAEHCGLVILAVHDTAIAYSAATTRPLCTWQPHVGAVTSIVSAPPHVWTADSMGEIRLWDSPQLHAADGTPQRFECLRVLTGSITMLLSVPSASQVWSVSRNSVVVWDSVERRPLQELVCPPPPPPQQPQQQQPQQPQTAAPSVAAVPALLQPPQELSQPAGFVRAAPSQESPLPAAGSFQPLPSRAVVSRTFSHSVLSTSPGSPTTPMGVGSPQAPGIHRQLSLASSPSPPGGAGSPASPVAPLALSTPVKQRSIDGRAPPVPLPLAAAAVPPVVAVTVVPGNASAPHPVSLPVKSAGGSFLVSQSVPVAVGHVKQPSDTPQSLPAPSAPAERAPSPARSPTMAADAPRVPTSLGGRPLPSTPARCSAGTAAAQTVSAARAAMPTSSPASSSMGAHRPAQAPAQQSQPQPHRSPTMAGSGSNGGAQ
eukprot:m51a1_g4210 hypothetical protein (2256) ;mRNA; r:59266-66642